MKKILFSLLFVYSFLQLSDKCLAEIPAHLIADNDYAIFAGDENSVGRLVYQSNEIFVQNPITFSLNPNESYIYVLAMGGDPSWGAGIENLRGTINGKNILTLSSIQQSSDVSAYLTGFLDDVENNIVAYGTYNATLADVQLAFPNLTWSIATPSNDVYSFPRGSASILKVSLIELGLKENFSFSYLTNEIGVKIDKYLGTDSIVNIPENIDNKPVKIIGAQSFISNTNIQKVYLPNSIIKIEAQAFQWCSNLNEIALSTNLTHLGTPETGGAVFYECTSLTNIILPNSLTYLSGSMFQGTKIKNITIPSQLEYLGPWTFVNANELEEVKFLGPLPNEVGQSVFGGNSSNLSVKIVFGLSGWTNAPASWPLKTFGIKLILQVNSGEQIPVYLETDPVVNLSPLIDFLKSNPVNGLYNQSQYDSNRVAGQNDVVQSPFTYNLYTTNQIHNLGLGGIMLSRNTNNQLVMNYQILQSTNLQNWSPYQQNELVISNAPSDKMFLRIQAVDNSAFSTQSFSGPSEPPPSNPAPGPAPEPSPPTGSEPEVPGPRERSGSD